MFNCKVYIFLNKTSITFSMMMISLYSTYTTFDYAYIAQFSRNNIPRFFLFITLLFLTFLFILNPPKHLHETLINLLRPHLRSHITHIRFSYKVVNGTPVRLSIGSSLSQHHNLVDIFFKIPKYLFVMLIDSIWVLLIM